MQSDCLKGIDFGGSGPELTRLPESKQRTLFRTSLFTETLSGRTVFCEESDYQHLCRGCPYIGRRAADAAPEDGTQDC